MSLPLLALAAVDDLPGVQSCSYAIIARGRQTLVRASPMEAAVCLAVVRLPQYRSDLLVSAISPLVRGGEGDTATDAEGCLQRALLTILQSLCIRDYSLFGEAGGVLTAELTA
jgi:hypothetical protein